MIEYTCPDCGAIFLEMSAVDVFCPLCKTPCSELSAGGEMLGPHTVDPPKMITISNPGKSSWFKKKWKLKSGAAVSFGIPPFKSALSPAKHAEHLKLAADDTSRSCRRYSSAARFEWHPCHVDFLDAIDKVSASHGLREARWSYEGRRTLADGRVVVVVRD